MTRKFFVLVLFLMLFLLSSCEFPGVKIKPDDKIGKMQFLDYCEAPNIHEICGGFNQLFTGECEISTSTDTFWVSFGWAEATQEELDAFWESTSDWKMKFDGRLVDLSAFGTYDLVADGKPARVWDVCITNPPTGPHVIRFDFDSSMIPTGHFTEIWKFTVVDE